MSGPATLPETVSLLTDPGDYLLRPTRFKAPRLVVDLPDAGFKAVKPDREFGCLMAPIPQPLLKEIQDWVIENLRDEHLGPDGRELDPHVTVKFGFKDDGEETLERLRAMLLRHGPIQLILGSKLSTFPEGKDGVPLKIDVISPQLHQLNFAVTAEFPTETKFPTYVPHLTLGYLRAGAEPFYVKLRPPFLGRVAVVDQLRFGLKKRDAAPVELPLTPGGFLASLSKGMKFNIKSAGSCEQGERSDLTGCVPASGEGGQKETEAKEQRTFANPEKPRMKSEEDLKREDDELDAMMPQLDESQEDAMGDYCAGSYEDINKALNAGEAPKKGAKAAEEVERIIASVRPFDSPVTVFRGIKLSKDEETRFLEQLRDAEKTGEFLRFASFTSTSIDYKVASRFSKGRESSMVFEIACRQGMYLGKQVNGQREREMLLQKGSRFRVAGVREVNIAEGIKKRVVQLEQVL